MANIKVKEDDRKVTVGFSLKQSVREDFEVECNIAGINKSHKAQELFQQWVDQQREERNGRD